MPVQRYSSNNPRIAPKAPKPIKLENSNFKCFAADTPDSVDITPESSKGTKENEKKHTNPYFGPNGTPIMNPSTPIDLPTECNSSSELP